MGVPAEVLRWRMTETEFQSHRAQLATDPDADERVVYLLKLLVPLTAALVNAWGGSVRLTEHHLDPWKNARADNDPDKRVQTWAFMAFGFVEGGGSVN